MGFDYALVTRLSCRGRLRWGYTVCLPAKRGGGIGPRSARGLTGVEDMRMEMTRKPVIGIVSALDADEDRLVMPNRYANAVVSAGGAPVALPFTTDVSVYETLFPAIDGFLLSGGNDISPVRYGGDITYGKLSELTPGREELEYLILSFARQFNVPVLGICRGMQMMNVSLGGTLYEDIADQFACEDELAHWQQLDYALPTHTVRIDPDSILGSMLEIEEASVNTMHHQGVRTLAECLRACAWSSDGLIEGIEDPTLDFFIGVQWHPEFFAGGKIMGTLFRSLVRKAGEASSAARACGGCLRIVRNEQDGCWPEIAFADAI